MMMMMTMTMISQYHIHWMYDINTGYMIYHPHAIRHSAHIAHIALLIYWLILVCNVQDMWIGPRSGAEAGCLMLLGMSFDRGPGANSHGCTGDCHSSGSFTLRRPDQSRRDSPPIPTLITDLCHVMFVCWKKRPLQFARIKDVALYVWSFVEHEIKWM